MDNLTNYYSHPSEEMYGVTAYYTTTASTGTYIAVPHRFPKKRSIVQLILGIK